LVAEAEDRGDPAGDLLGRARGGDPGRGQRRRLDGQGNAGAAPVQLLRVDDRAQALAVGGHALDVVEAVQAPGARLADDLPRHLLRAVVLGGGRADDLLCEPVAVPLVREGLVAEAEVHHPSLTYGGVQQTRHGYARPGCPAVPSPRSSLPALPSSSPRAAASPRTRARPPRPRSASRARSPRRPSSSASRPSPPATPRAWAAPTREPTPPPLVTPSHPAPPTRTRHGSFT